VLMSCDGPKDSMFKRGVRDCKESFLMLYEMDILEAIQVSTSDRPSRMRAPGSVSPSLYSQIR
jgi:hypothetical protein